MTPNQTANQRKRQIVDSCDEEVAIKAHAARARSVVSSILLDVIEDHSMSIRTLADKSGETTKRVCMYLSGVHTAPIHVLRAAYKQTKDQRLVDLILNGD